MTGNPDPSSLDNLFDIVVPPPVSWWPPAPGWYVVGGLAIALAVWAARRGWQRCMEDHPTLGTEVVGGATYVIAQHDLALFAMRPGRYDIPSFTVRFASANAPGEQPVEHRLTTPPLRIEARLPPGAEHLPSLISTSAMTVSEPWKPEPKEPRVGDAFTRTVTRSAPDVPAMAFPPLPVTDLDRLAVYPKPPVMQDHSERGTFTGTRVDSITYVCERPGTVTVPALEFPWWNVRTQTLEKIMLPAVSLDVGHAPLSQSTRNRLGAAAPGGAKSYIKDGQMTGGFALVAYPAEYHSSGLMTFIVGPQGVVFQKDLGEKTAELGKAMTEYNPDDTWTPARDTPPAPAKRAGPS